MVKTISKSKNKVARIIIFFALATFPFGQLLSVDLSFLSAKLHLLDVLVGFGFGWFLLTNKKRKFKVFIPFFLVLLFSYLLSLLMFGANETLSGGLYLIRLVSYFGFAVLVLDFAKTKEFKKKLVASLVLVSSAAAIFGWVQYFLFINFTPFLEFGWDDHLFRLAGTFLDPNFLGIILVLGFLGAAKFYKEERSKLWLLASVFLVFSLLFTYSRSSYLALAAGSFFLFLKDNKRAVLTVLVGIMLGIFLLPKPGGEGVNLSRTASIFARLGNYQEGIQLFGEFPLFGVGYNNICFARGEVVGKTGLLTNSCSGFDASVLTLLATTGLAGLIAFVDLIIRLLKNLRKAIYSEILMASGTSLLVHSVFVNSMFYSWVMLWFAILLGVSLRGVVKGK